MLGYTTEDSLSSPDSEDEYVPESVGETESDTPAEKVNQHKGKKRKKETTSANSQGADVQAHKTRRIAPSCSLAANDESSDVTVKTLKKKQNGNRVYERKFYCLFCSIPFCKMARHLESKHKDEPEVARAVLFPKGSKERKIQMSLLRNRGNRAHNNQVLEQGKGMVIPHQLPSAPVKAKDYMHCVNCEAYLKRKSLWRHMQRCHLNKKVKGLKPGKTRVQTICAFAQPVPDSVSAQFWKLVLNMHEDNVTDVVRKERSILKLGEHLFNKHGHDVTKHEYVRQKMRETGRLLIQGQENGKLKTMSDFFVPANFPHVIEAVKNVAGLNEETNAYKTPSLALKLGHNLKKIANIIECEAMISGDENTTHNVRVFKQICDTKWNECVSSQALRNLCEAKWNVPQLLPFAEDVRKMHQFLSVQRTEYHRKLEEEPSKKPWAELAKTTLCDVILFNRRREGEVSKMPLSAFTSRDTSSTHPDVELALSDLEKKLCKHFERIEIRGKRGRKVPILLTPDMLASMELLVKTRRICDVSDDNQFMFGRPQALTYFRGSDVIRQVARSCGANHPEALSSTKLRKHMATMSKVLNLKDNEMDDLADFLGHDIRVHRQYYRLPEGTLQLAKISKVLMALERGQLAEFKGKNLDEIAIDPEGNGLCKK